MALIPGTRLGPYEVIAPIGAGGMGEVYKARDTKLNRDVAIKILPDSFAHDPERVARFKREAQVLAALNHPHIAQIYGLEESNGISALVMEFVEGPTLADRIAQSAIPIDEALPIAKQIAEALEVAHELGIIHRDLKPANIKVKDDGTVKVLDFGLAKALGPAEAGHYASDGSVRLEADFSASPTITSPAMMTRLRQGYGEAGTMPGMILGTAAYMAPEQAKGRAVDKRADIWAFGCVLFEMLTGRRAFPGDDVSDTLAAVLMKEPDWTALPATVPPAVVTVLRRCLQKDRRQRMRDIGDVSLALEGAFETAPPQTTATAPASTLRGRLAWMAFAVAAMVIVALAIPALRHLRETPPEEPSLQFSLPLPANSTVGFLEMSPDGRRLLVSGLRDGKFQLYLRSLDSPEWQRLAGVDRARTPFWSPDSRFIGFFADNALRVIPAAGGPARVLCSETGLGGGGTWSPSGVILFGSETGPLRRVDAAGGTCVVVGKDDPQSWVGYPVFLPDGNHFFYVGAMRGDAASRGVYLAALDDLTPRKILADYSSVVYAPPLAGGHAHLLFLRDTTLMAQPFDAATLEAVGDPFPVASRAATTANPPQVAASVSNGTLVHLARRSRESQLTWFDRSGKALGTAGPRAQHTAVVLSPDGNAVLTSRPESTGQSTLWVYDLARGSESRFLPPGTQSGRPVWFPDGRRVLFTMISATAKRGVYQKDASGGGQPALVLPIAVDASFVPSAFSPDGRFLVYTVVDPKTRADIWSVPWNAKPDLGKAVKFVATDATESQGQVSPDGKWIAYTSNETGEYEVYIRPFPDGPGVGKVSVDGGQEPRWSADGKQLYYARLLTGLRSALLAAAVEADGRGGLRTGTPQTLFDIHAVAITPDSNTLSYSPHPDGKRFLVNTLAEEGEATINVITHWQKTMSDRQAP